MDTPLYWQYVLCSQNCVWVCLQQRILQTAPYSHPQQQIFSFSLFLLSFFSSCLLFQAFVLFLSLSSTHGFELRLSFSRSREACWEIWALIIQTGRLPFFWFRRLSCLPSTFSSFLSFFLLPPFGRNVTSRSLSLCFINFLSFCHTLGDKIVGTLSEWVSDCTWVELWD